MPIVCRCFLLFCLVVFGIASFAQSDVFLMEQYKFRAEMNSAYADTISSPLKESDRLSFSGLPFFEPDTAFLVSASLERIVDGAIVEMATTTDRIARYRVYARLVFELIGDSYVLFLYEYVPKTPVERIEEYPLFLPFTDLTNGETTYPGGRYVDVVRQDGDVWTIDFNKSYNPYCAYNDKYSCPVPPRENHLPLLVNAGVMYKQKGNY